MNPIQNLSPCFININLKITLYLYLVVPDYISMYIFQTHTIIFYLFTPLYLVKSADYEAAHYAVFPSSSFFVSTGAKH